MNSKGKWASLVCICGCFWMQLDKQITQVEAQGIGKGVTFTTNEHGLVLTSTVASGPTNFLRSPLKPMTDEEKAKVEAHIQAMKNDGTIDNVASLLASQGYVCKTSAHNWRAGRPGEGELSGNPGVSFWFLDSHPNTNFRTCRICGVCQTQDLQWK